MAVFDLTKASFQQLLNYAESQYRDWQREEIIREREDRMAKLHTMGLSCGGRAIHAMRIYRELLEREVRQRIKFYADLAENSGNPEMLSEKRLDEHRDRIMTTVRAACGSLQGRIGQDGAAAGDSSALPNPHRYIVLEADILDVVNSKIRVLRSKGAIIGAHEPTTAQADAKRSRRNPNNEKIDEELRAIARSRPQNHQEVFKCLQGRAKTAVAEPFRTAGGWMAGFESNPPLARAWLSKQWARLRLPKFPRGPKRPRATPVGRQRPGEPGRKGPK